MKVTTAQQSRLLRWAQQQLDTDGWSDDAYAFGIVEPRAGRLPLLRAVMVVNHHVGRSCRVHIATDGSRRWATADVLTRLSAFLHMAHNVDRLWMIVSVFNTKALIAALKIGFQIDGRERCSADDGTDGIVLTMLRHENPWLRGQEHG